MPSSSAAARQIGDGKGEPVFAALLRALHAPEGDEASTLAAMPRLEAMMHARADVGGYLMARLYPIAGRHRLHHTYRAIELWMHETVNDELVDNLTRLAGESARPKVRVRYQEWAARMRAAPRAMRARRFKDRALAVLASLEAALPGFPLRDVAELVRYSETQVAIEILCDNLVEEYGWVCPRDVLPELVAIAREAGVEPTYWERFRPG